MIAGNPASGKRAAVSVDSMPEHRGKKRVLRSHFSVSAMDGRHFRSCIQNLALHEQRSAP